MTISDGAADAVGVGVGVGVAVGVGVGLEVGSVTGLGAPGVGTPFDCTSVSERAAASVGAAK
ncbi:hypothetical protein E3T55_00875 [Cryobacterium frigoriphilum]|uniref:Uncharacterized protein n=1 Tax=Cryobacterium frigoriphilum TaxID=1259150 RepID=A0A4R9AAX0_9MICO|nr:hypothetical protein E3T55_00875 [Cryobacterium frigoriphilum]